MIFGRPKSETLARRGQRDHPGVQIQKRRLPVELHDRRLPVAVPGGDEWRPRLIQSIADLVGAAEALFVSLSYVP